MDNYPLAISEWHSLVKGLKSAYVSQNLLATDEAVKIWYSLLRDIPYKILNAATMSWIATEHFPPTIADLRQRALRMTQPERHEWSEAWQMVRRAMQIYGYYRKDEAMESMPEDVRAAADRIGWSELCLMPIEQEQVYRAQFRDIYNAITNRRAEQQVLPGRIQAMIGEIQGALDVKIDSSD